MWGCIRSVLAGGILGAVLGYFIAGFFIENSTKREMFWFIRWGFVASGSVLGVFLWTLGEAAYFYFFLKKEKEDIR